jgi:hypothetical protein
MRAAAGASPCGPSGPAIDVPTFHGDARRLGWNAEERHLGPARVGGPDFGPLWSSPALDAVVWVLDSSQPRTAALAGPGAARPVLYAFDAATLALLWRSAPEALEVGGKYSAPTVARGRVFVGTDRIQAFELRPR